jgi:type I restriction enzyme R subunit
LIEKYHESNFEDKQIYSSIEKSILSSPTLRNKKELIEEFIKQTNIDFKKEVAQSIEET